MKIKAYEIKDLVEREKYAGYLVYGQNKGLVREKSQTIINSYKNDETEIIKFENDELISEPGKLSNEFNTFSLTAKKKILHILNTKDNLTEIITNTVIDDQASINLIVFETGELPPRSKLRKFFEKEKHLGILACYFDTEQDVKGLIETTFKKEDMLINTDISLLIAKHLGNERHIIKSELEKIILYLKDKKEFKAEDILKCLGQNEDFGFDNLNYNLCDGNVVKLDKIINQLYLQGISPIALLRSVDKHFQKILFVNQKIDSGIDLNESFIKLKPPIFFLYINQFKNQVKKWKTSLCYKAIERIMETEKLCKLNSKISKIVCWRTLRNIASIKYS
jgi:DNA polymerase-3 subunit delta